MFCTSPFLTGTRSGFEDPVTALGSAFSLMLGTPWGSLCADSRMQRWEEDRQTFRLMQMKANPLFPGGETEARV